MAAGAQHGKDQCYNIRRGSAEQERWQPVLDGALASGMLEAHGTPDFVELRLTEKAIQHIQIGSLLEGGGSPSSGPRRMTHSRCRFWS